MTGMAVSMKGSKRARHKANVPDRRVKKPADPIKQFFQKQYRIVALQQRNIRGEMSANNFKEAESLGMTFHEATSA
jgi:hypothetical protein